MTDNKKIPKGWGKYPPHKILHEGSTASYQKKIGSFFINITEWTYSDKKSYELDIQIHSNASITGRTINIVNFKYEKLSFAEIEKDGKKIIKALTNPPTL